MRRKVIFSKEINYKDIGKKLFVVIENRVINVYEDTINNRPYLEKH